MITLNLNAPARKAPPGRHPRGLRARVLLSSVFGPYAQDDEYGSRKINPMELYHNQVTRAQGPFSPRMFHRSFNLMLLQANIDAPCVLLDFPTQQRFIEELRRHPYDVVGISAIMPNVGKVRKMCELIREHLPRAVIVLGGHAANMPDIHQLVDADHIVNGDGIRWFRRFLGQPEDERVRHPLTHTSFGARIFGLRIPDAIASDAATLMPSAGCPMGCNFCSTSHMFGGKGRFLNFYETGDELFEIMCGLEEKLKVQSFGVMDENFLLHRKRALRLLELMEKHGKSWSLSVFSSARVLRTYTLEQLVGLGVSWVWIGLEGESSRYDKLNGVDTRDLVRELQSHGVRILGSTIIGLEEHTPENMDRVIEWAVSHDTDFHQFMLYTALPGTPLYLLHRGDGTLLGPGEIPYADVHGQLRFNHRHKHIRDGRENEFLLRGFRRDFEVNGPSLARMIRTTLLGWKRHKHHPSARVRARYAREAASLPTVFSGMVWAMRRAYRKNAAMRARLGALFNDLSAEFGWRPRVCGPALGIFILLGILAERRRLARGGAYEPPVFYEMNRAASEIFGRRTCFARFRGDRLPKRVEAVRLSGHYGAPSFAARV